MSNVEVLFTGGGTGGHVFPGLSLVSDILKILHKKYPQKTFDIKVFAWIGSSSGPEKFFVENAGMDFYPVRAGKLRRYFSPQNLTDCINIIMGFFQARTIIKRIQPKVLVSIGGYASFPAVLAAAMYRIPVVSVSCDISLGLAAKISLPFSTFVCSAYQETAAACKKSSNILKIFSYQMKKRKKLFDTIDQRVLEQLCIAYDDIDSWIMGYGNPIRKEVYSGNPSSINNKYRIRKNNIVILCLGGSKGAHQINELVLRLLPKFADNITVVHQTGFQNNHVLSRNLPNIACQYIPIPFITGDYADMLARADVVIARAGAGTLWEVVANEVPSLIIPLSKESSRGDQLENAQYFAEKGMLVNVGPHPSDDEVYETLTRLYTDRPTIKKIQQACKSFGATRAAASISQYIGLFL